MVIKIYAPAPSVSSGLQYNERKVAEGKASVIYSQKIDDLRNPMATFQRYENGSIRCEKMSFHASVNPSITDQIPPEKIPEFVREYMEKMGYGNQPYILYKHTDTGRDHYHIVSVRVDENGRKIPDFRERVHSQQVMKELSSKYGFKVGKDVEDEKEGLDPSFNPYDGFDPEKGDIGKQMVAIIELVLSYHFTTPEHFDLVMEYYGVRVVRGSFEEHEWMELQGLDPKTKEPCTPLVDPPEDYLDLPDIVAQRAESCKGQIKTREKQRVANISKTALSKCRTEQHFLRYMEKCEIHVRFSKRDDGVIFGVTFVDHHNKCVFKASELPGIKASMFEDARQNIWGPNEHRDEKEESTVSEIADLAIAALGAERSRRNEVEEIMRRGRKGPSY